MKYFTLFAVFGVLCLAGSKDKSIRVDEVKSGRQLDNAKEATFEFFFENRTPSIDLRSGAAASDILLETDSFIYFGYVSHDVVFKFHKVQTEEVLTKFPLYKNVTSDSIRRIAATFFWRKYPPSTWSSSYIEKAIYRPNNILVRFSYKPNGKKTKLLKDSILLNKTDLSIIK